MTNVKQRTDIDKYNLYSLRSVFLVKIMIQQYISYSLVLLFLIYSGTLKMIYYKEQWNNAK